MKRETALFLIAGVIVGVGFVLAKTGSLTDLFALAPQSPASVSQAEIFRLINENRVHAGVPALTQNVLLNSAAQAKADDMLNRGYYSHVTPEGYSPLYWLEKVGYKYRNVGENLDLTYIGTDIAVTTAWMNSSEHRKNLLMSDYTETGIGIARGMYQGEQVTFVVQEFATPFPSIAKIPIVQALFTHGTAAPLSASASTGASEGNSSLSRALYRGITGDDVRTLQKILNAHGYRIASVGPGSLGNETTYFGAGTQAAVIAFQIAQGISPAAGYVGPRTRAALGAL